MSHKWQQFAYWTSCFVCGQEKKMIFFRLLSIWPALDQRLRQTNDLLNSVFVSFVPTMRKLGWLYRCDKILGHDTRTNVQCSYCLRLTATHPLAVILLPVFSSGERVPIKYWCCHSARGYIRLHTNKRSFVYVFVECIQSHYTITLRVHLMNRYDYWYVAF